MSSEIRGGNAPSLDLSLLQGFRFSCLPGCGLCCYATPAVSPEEKPRLLAVDPSTPWIPGENGYVRVASRAGGGACHFLTDNRCRCHDVRPFPCREFPISVHVGTRAQAALNLFCPGISIGKIGRWQDTVPETTAQGLEGELEAVTGEFRRAPVAAWIQEGQHLEETVRRRLGRRGLWTEPEALREELRSALPLPDASDFPPGDPGGSGTLDDLLLFYDGLPGRVALRPRDEGWEVIRVAEAGGIQEVLGTYIPPQEPVELKPPVLEMLRGYLSYALERDQLLWGVYRELWSHGEVSTVQMAEAFLREAATQAVSIGYVHAMANGRVPSPLASEDLATGIRAADMLLMDQPTLGRFL